MTGYDWSRRREEHTRRAIDYARGVDFPTKLLTIYYPEMARNKQPPCHYILDCGDTYPCTRKQSMLFKGLRIFYLPNGSVEFAFK